MNSDHRDNIGTHPAFSKDPETALRARLDAARIQRNRAEEAYTKARNNLRVFLDTQEPGVYHIVPDRVTVTRAELGITVDSEQEAKPSRARRVVRQTRCFS